ncbi:MAG: glycosyltransferase family 2 protein [Chloroflexota bacterium]
MSTELPLVTVVTPSYNQADFIEETICSVFRQEYPNIEHLVMDGGSTDGTVEILKKYQSKYNLKWISEADSGQSDALNKGFRRASGAIIGWLNSDDTYMPDAIQTAVEYLAANPASGWAYGDGYWIDETSRVLSEKYSGPYSLANLVYKGMYVTQPSMFIHKATLDKVGYLDESIHTTMDYDFCLRLGYHSDAVYIPQKLSTRRLHSEAKTEAVSVNFYDDAIRSMDKLFARADLPDDVMALRDDAYARRHMIGGYQAFSAGQYERARNLLEASLALRPKYLQKEGLLMRLLILESYFGLTWLTPGHSRRQAEQKYAAEHGNVYVNWSLSEPTVQNAMAPR